MNNLMKTDIKETKDAYLLDIEVTGCNKEDIKIQVKNNNLIVTMNKKERTGNYIKRESSAGEYTRTYDLGDIQKTDGYISARVDNGMLYVSIDKDAYKVDTTYIDIM